MRGGVQADARAGQIHEGAAGVGVPDLADQQVVHRRPLDRLELGIQRRPRGIGQRPSQRVLQGIADVVFNGVFQRDDLARGRNTAHQRSDRGRLARADDACQHNRPALALARPQQGLGLPRQITQRKQVTVYGRVQPQDAQAHRRPRIGGKRGPTQHDGHGFQVERNAPLLFERGVEHRTVAAAHIHPGPLPAHPAAWSWTGP